MKSLVIYESVFSNTERIAFAIRDALISSGDSVAMQPEKVKPDDLKNYDMMVIGSPTQ
ncbi:MAG: hypothetical protein K0B15_00020 [Lentimicrobium sp.]|nr:hypothetical protein [Lentimicrobium sp.]